MRVVDSTADYRWMVLPLRPAGTEGWNEERLASIVREGDMIGVTVPRAQNLSRLAGEGGAFEKDVQGAVEATAAHVGGFRCVVPLDELTALAWREVLERLARFRAFFQGSLQVRRNGKTSRLAV